MSKFTDWRDKQPSHLDDGDTELLVAKYHEEESTDNEKQDSNDTTKINSIE